MARIGTHGKTPSGSVRRCNIATLQALGWSNLLSRTARLAAAPGACPAAPRRTGIEINDRPLNLSRHIIGEVERVGRCVVFHISVGDTLDIAAAPQATCHRCKGPNEKRGLSGLSGTARSSLVKVCQPKQRVSHFSLQNSSCAVIQPAAQALPLGAEQRTRSPTSSSTIYLVRSLCGTATSLWRNNLDNGALISDVISSPLSTPPHFRFFTYHTF
jgi:hypothetical protein